MSGFQSDPACSGPQLQVDIYKHGVLLPLKLFQGEIAKLLSHDAWSVPTSRRFATTVIKGKRVYVNTNILDHGRACQAYRQELAANQAQAGGFPIRREQDEATIRRRRKGPGQRGR